VSDFVVYPPTGLKASERKTGTTQSTTQWTIWHLYVVVHCRLMFFLLRLGCRKLFNIQVSEVQPGDADISPVARQSSGLRPQLRQQRRRRQLRSSNVHRAGHLEQL